jgi:hypothetical protein
VHELRINQRLQLEGLWLDPSGCGLLKSKT